MEPAKQVPNGRGTMPQQHAWVGLHRHATLRLRWTPNNEACCEWVPVDLLRRWHLRTTSRTGCSLQLAAETNLEIMKSKRQQQQQPYFDIFYLVLNVQISTHGKIRNFFTNTLFSSESDINKHEHGNWQVKPCRLVYEFCLWILIENTQYCRFISQMFSQTIIRTNQNAGPTKRFSCRLIRTN